MTQDKRRSLFIPYAGPALLEMPLLNKGSAFDVDERVAFNLIGLLPETIETIEEQVQRAYRQYQTCTTDLDRHIYLRAIQDDNETLFFRLLEEHLEEMLPIIYTPIVGQACQQFSSIYRNHRGIFVSYPDRHRIDDIIRSVTKDNVKVIVVTDSEQILGLGDQGIGGMGIPIGKLSLYTACGGISPAYTLPIALDVGTNNTALLEDPMYMGWRHERIGDAEYAEYIELFIQAVKRRWPNVLLQFEDFAQSHSWSILSRYRDQLCCFNDDIQGTAAVCVGCLLAACKAKNERVSDQTIMFVGAGSAGCGIAEQVVCAMVDEGLTDAEARARIFMVDHYGLVVDSIAGLLDYNRRLAQPQSRIDEWPADTSGNPILSVMKNAKPTVLIGVSGQRGIFTQEIIECMHEQCANPFIMPLSNPPSNIEATPEEILTWTNGDALVAVGSPFPPVEVNGGQRPIRQCNNSYIFPGIGLGVIAANASRVTDNMLMVAAWALAECSPLGVHGKGALLPPLGQVREVSRAIALAVAKQAQQDGVALATSDEVIQDNVQHNFWYPRYRHYRRAAF